MKTFNKNVFKQPFFWTSVCSLLALGILIGLYSYAWVAPTANPNNSAGAGISFSGGNVGIGTTNPSTGRLQIDGYNYNQNLITLQTSNQTARTYGIGTYLTGTGAGLVIRDNTAALERLVINDLGNVGIGTAAPGEKLEVAGNVKITGTGNGIKFPDGTSQTTAATAGGTMSWPTSVKKTTATHNGSFATSPANGYVALNTWIQSNGCSGYHVCMPWEISYAFSYLSDANLCGDGTCNGIATTGLTTTISGYSTTDCSGWRSNSNMV